MLRMSVDRPRGPVRKRVIAALGGVVLVAMLLVTAPGANAAQTAHPSGTHSGASDLVRATAGGTVHVWQGWGGRWVAVNDQGYYHLENVQVGDGQRIAAGTVLGTARRSG